MGKLCVIVAGETAAQNVFIHHELSKIAGWVIDVRSCTKTELKEFDSVSADVIILDAHVMNPDEVKALRSWNYAGPVILIIDGIAGDAFDVDDCIEREKVSAGSLQRSIVNAMEKAKLRSTVFEQGRDLNFLRGRMTEITSLLHKLRIYIDENKKEAASATCDEIERLI